MLNNIGELTSSKLNGSDFIYPILSLAGRTKVYGHQYIPLVDIPGMMYASHPPSSNLGDLFIQVFPICIINTLLCVVAGFVCWLLEARKNEKEFPKGFFIGWCEGFWWAFVSMTTVSVIHMRLNPEMIHTINQNLFLAHFNTFPHPNPNPSHVLPI